MSGLKKKLNRKSILLNVRFLVICIITLITAFYNASYAMMSSLDTTVEQTLNISTVDYEYLFSSYTLASAVSCLFGGVVTDKYLGIKVGSVVFGSLALLGEGLVTGGGLLESYWLMLVGRLFLGAGSECLAVLLNCYAVVWFDERELGFVFGLFLMFGKGFGTSIAFLLAVPFYRLSEKYVPPKLVLGVSMIPYLILMIILVLLTLLLSKITSGFGKTLKSTKCLKKVELKRIMNFKRDFWLFNLMLSLCTVSVTSFLPCSQQILIDKFSLDPNEANQQNILFNMFVALFTPIPGYLAGKTGYSLYYDLFGTVLGVISLIIFILTNSNPAIPLVLYALYFSILNSSTWNLVVFLVDEYQLATAYGTISVTIHLLTTFSNIAVGYLLEHYGTDGVLSLLLLIVTTTLLFTTVLLLLDKMRYGLLNLSSSEKQKRLNSS